MFSLLGSGNLKLGREGRREGMKQRKRGVEIEMETDREGEMEGVGPWCKKAQKYDKFICLERKHGSR